jgi:hypothetical protein
VGSGGFDVPDQEHGANDPPNRGILSTNSIRHEEEQEQEQQGAREKKRKEWEEDQKKKVGRTTRPRRRTRAGEKGKRIGRRARTTGKGGTRRGGRINTSDMRDGNG